jgi:hypothetical protein
MVWFSKHNKIKSQLHLDINNKHPSIYTTFKMTRLMASHQFLSYKQKKELKFTHKMWLFWFAVADETIWIWTWLPLKAVFLP